MSSKVEYYRPTVTKSIELSIVELFKKYPDVGRYYDHNKVKFVEDGIRRLIIYYEEQKKAGARIDHS